MKTLKNKLIVLLSLLLVFSCNEGIDPITEVDPGPDAGAPVVTIIKPINGFVVQVPEPVTSVKIEINAKDDIEVSLIKIKMDGVEIASYSEFTDYRIINREMTYNNVTTGDHVLTVEATDIAGNVTTSTSNFSKAPPYTPQFNGEMFYMNFDGSYSNLVTNKNATEVGSPGFTSDAYVGSKAYQGAPDSYLTFPSAGLLANEFSATFWLKIDPSDTRAGIINIAPADPSSPSDKPSGFGLMREGSGTAQKFILLVGNGTNATWVNPGGPATINPTDDKWVHFGISISESNVALYMDGELVGQSDFPGIDWTGVGDLSIMSGDPNFSGWGHKTEKGQMDELRLFNKALTQSEIQTIKLKDQAVFSVNFNGNYQDAVSGTEAIVVGSPDFASGIKGQAYQGAPDSYLTFPSAGLLANEFSATFWLKIDASDTRAGIINITPADPAGPSDKPSGFGLIREGNATAQKFILLVGNGTNSTWVNPGDPATINPADGKWVHFGISISNSNAALYMDGVLVGQSDFPGIDWTGVGDLVIMSGDPNFSGWNHKTEKGQMDELYIYNKALTAEEIQAIMNN